MNDIISNLQRHAKYMIEANELRIEKLNKDTTISAQRRDSLLSWWESEKHTYGVILKMLEFNGHAPEPDAAGCLRQ